MKSIKQKIDNFVAAPPGSLWCFDYLNIRSGFSWGLFYLPKNKNPEHFIEYEHDIIDDTHAIIKLGEKRQVKIEDYIAKMIKRDYEKQKIDMIYKVLTTTIAGEVKIGWISKEVVQNLKVHDGCNIKQK